MTLPYERFNSLVSARTFLEALLDPKRTPRVPKEIRREARWRLKHYPSGYELERIREKCEEILGECEKSKETRQK